MEQQPMDGDAGDGEHRHGVVQGALHLGGIARDVRPEERTSDDGQGGAHREPDDVDLLAITKVLTGTRGMLRHHLRVGRHPALVERGLQRAPLASMLLVLAGEKAMAEKRTHHLRAAVLVERGGLGDHHFVHELRIAREVHRPRTEPIAHESAVLAAERGEEPERIAAQAQQTSEPQPRGRVRVSNALHAAAPSLKSSSISRANRCPTILRFTFMVGVSSPDSIVNSTGRIWNRLIVSKEASSPLTAFTRSAMRATKRGSRAISSMVPQAEPQALASRTAASRSSVNRAARCLRASPTTTACAMPGIPPRSFSMFCGDTFFPPEVMMRSFFRSVMRKKPSRSSSPTSPVRKKPSGVNASAVAAGSL